MEKKTTPKERPTDAKATPVQPEGPLKVFRTDDVSASVFARTRNIQGADRIFYSVSLSRSYKDSDGTRKYTKNFDADDLGALASVIQQAGEYVRAQRSERVD